jgi:ABC-type branched-subunit amino acid transport system ATPase component
MELDEILAEFPLPEKLLARRAGLLSDGQRQLLALATALASRPEMLVLDEPSAGLAPETAEGVFATIVKLRRSGLAVLVAEQNLDWMHGVADTVVTLVEGRVVPT